MKVDIQSYLKIKDLLEVLFNADSKKGNKLRAGFDIETIEQMQKHITQVEAENPNIEKIN